MEILVGIITLFVVVPIIGIILYIIVMLNKAKQFPLLNFERFFDEKNQTAVKEIEQLTNKSIKGTKGWILLATLFMSIYYLLNIWSILFVLLNLFVVAYYNEFNLSLANIRFCIVLFSLLSATFTFLDNWLDSKEKSRTFHENWFKTSVIAKRFIAKVETINDFELLCNEVDNMISFMHESIKNTKFL